MLLQRISLNGFKSFAKKTEIDLNFPITAFVGPNGSGKSNVADAIRWVIGEQGLKNIRATKQEDLIFAGSATKAPKGMAEVKLRFDNSGGFFPSSYAELEIGRTIHKDSSSEYWLNGNKMLLRELGDMMAQSGLGSYDLAVIGQGEIDQILIMGSREIQSLLEDASGVKPFYIKKNRTGNRLKRAAENIRRLHDILAELEPRLRELKRESRQAEIYLELKADVVALQRLWFGGNLHKLRSDVAQVDASLDRLKAQRAEIETTLEARHQEVRAVEQALREQQAALGERQKDIDKLQDALGAVWREQATIKAKLDLTRNRLAGLGENKDAAEITRLEKDRAELETALAAVDKDKADADQALNAARETLDVLRQKHQAKLDELADLSGRVVKRVDLPGLRGKLQTFKSLYAELAATLFADQLTAKALAKAYAESRATHQKLQPLLGELIDSVAEKDEKLEQEVRKLRAETDAVLADVRKQQQALAQTQQQERDLSRKQFDLQGKLQKIAGRLGQLAKSDTSDHAELRKALLKEQEYLQAQEQQLNKDVSAREAEIKARKAALQQGLAAQNRSRDIAALRMQIGEQNRKLQQLKDQEQSLVIQKTRFETRAEDVAQRAEQELGLSAAEVKALFETADGEAPAPPTGDALMQLEREIAQARHKLGQIGEVNQKAPQEYEAVRGRHEWLYSQIADLEATAKYIETSLAELDRYVEKLFDQVFLETQTRFADFFQVLFGGGEGKLVLNVNVFGEKEISIRARPPGKRMHDLNLLSGGERSMGAVALLFAILETCKTPFCVLDEVDAALDEANVGRFVDALARLNRQTQIVLVTHNRRTMQAADCLYGATMEEDGATQIVSLKLQDYADKAS